MLEEGQHKTNQRSLRAFLNNGSGYPSAVDVVALLGVFLVATVLSSLLAGLLQKAGLLSAGLATFVAYVIQFVVTIAFALVQRIRRMPKEVSGLKFGLSRVDFTVILWGMIVVIATGIVIEPLLALLPDAYMEAISSLMGRGGWMMLTSIVVAPVLEETLFRGIVQDSLTYKYGPWKGIVFGAAVFGIVHIIPQQVINAFLIGLVLGYIYYQTRSLIPVMVIHCINNAIAYFSWVMGGEKLVSTSQQLGNDTSYYILYALAVVIFGIAFVCMTLSIRRAEVRKIAAAVGSETDETLNARTENTKTGSSNVIS